MNLDGYIRLHRKLQKNLVWTQCPSNVFKFFAYCMMQANWEPSVWHDGTREHQLDAGTFVATLRAMSADCYLSQRQIRSSIVDLENLEIISVRAISESGIFHVVTVINYEPYQSSEEKEEIHRTLRCPKVVENPVEKCLQKAVSKIEVFKDVRSLNTNNNKRTNVNGSVVSQTDVRSFVEQRNFLKKALAGYFEGERGEPDDDLVIRVMDAGNGATAEEIGAALRYLHQHGQSPRDPNGPRTWGWFPKVIAKKFSTRERTGTA